MVWNWVDGGPGPARFWFRRTAHEIVVHRADAEGGGRRIGTSRVEPAELASDGIDEFLHFLHMRSRTDAGRRSCRAATTSTPPTSPGNGSWTSSLSGVTVRREHEKADVAVQGPASDLELFLYNRGGTEGLKVFGDPAAVAAWTEQIRR